jgi:hypothetical protein
MTSETGGDVCLHGRKNGAAQDAAPWRGVDKQCALHRQPASE